MEVRMNNVTISRRGLLWSGAAITLVAAGGMIAAWRARPADPAGPAYSAWTLWNDASVRNTPLALVAAGVLAANPHDTQPWLFHVTDNSIEIFADTSRHLGAMDPFLRELHIGLGCAVENMALAAPANGYRVVVEPVAGALDKLADRRGAALAATLRLARIDAPSSPVPAYEAIPRRHTNRYPYDRAKPLPDGWRDALSGLVDHPDVRLFLFDAGASRAAYDSAVIESTQAIIDDAAMIADSDRWIRSTPAEIEQFRSGPTLETAGLSPMTLLLAKTLPLPDSMKHDGWFTQTRDGMLATAPLTGLIAVRDRYDRPLALAAGRVWQRLHLNGTLAGVAMQPLNQPAELVDRDRQLGRDRGWDRRVADLTETTDWQPTFFFRAGISNAVAGPSPRRALADTLTG